MVSVSNNQRLAMMWTLIYQFIEKLSIEKTQIQFSLIWDDLFVWVKGKQNFCQLNFAEVLKCPNLVISLRQLSFSEWATFRKLAAYCKAILDFHTSHGAF